MIGIVVITHGKLADELISAVDFVLAGKTTAKMVGVSLDTSQDFENFTDIINSSIENVDEGEGVLLVTDMFGGTPSNIGLTFLENKKVEVISGVNLPMLLKLGTLNEKTTLNEAVKLAEKAGKDNIIIASNLLNK
ncbi:MAG: PTS fructose transporter subunit IIA [Candidatus Dadabacteria bacterium]|nr:PTS fructose transporter subunit IIA [Candidatus Dadabacteria bacterium]NIQ13416.1 PTS fructose transporter subunit IIA [Candidatus Dadabacteria bacterium]